MRKPQITVPLVNLAFASLASGIVLAFIVVSSDGLMEGVDEWPKGQIESPEEISYTDSNAKAVRAESLPE